MKISRRVDSPTGLYLARRGIKSVIDTSLPYPPPFGYRTHLVLNLSNRWNVFLSACTSSMSTDRSYACQWLSIFLLKLQYSLIFDIQFDLCSIVRSLIFLTDMPMRSNTSFIVTGLPFWIYIINWKLNSHKFQLQTTTTTKFGTDDVTLPIAKGGVSYDG